MFKINFFLFIGIEGFIKTPIRLLVTVINKERITYGTGAITDGKFKVEVKIRNFESKDQYFNKEDNVEVIGNLIINSEFLFNQFNF